MRNIFTIPNAVGMGIGLALILGMEFTLQWFGASPEGAAYRIPAALVCGVVAVIFVNAKKSSG